MSGVKSGPFARAECVLKILRGLDTDGKGFIARERMAKFISALLPEVTLESIDLLMDASSHADAARVWYQGFIAWLFGGKSFSASGGSSGISVATWNVAAVNNNPFEYWLSHDDPSYTKLMVAMEESLEKPELDVPVGEIFTEAMFQELKALMSEHCIAGVEEVEESMWHGDLGLRKRRIVSDFLKDKSLGAKRLISMPDRITNTIHVVTRAPSEYKPPPACRPTVINNYLGDLSTLEVWWESWKRFMFLEALAVRAQDGLARVQRPCHMLEPIPKSKYPAITPAEERLAIPLQLLCQAIFDAILVHLMHVCSPDGSWQTVKSEICDKLYVGKTRRTIEILERSYASADVICLQEAAATFCDLLRRSRVSERYECVRPKSMDGLRDQNSLLLLSRDFFLPSSIQDVTHVIEECLEGVRLVSCDLVAVAAEGRCGRSYLLASFHGDTAGCLTLPLLRALRKALDRFPRHVVIMGLDANSYEPAKAEQLPYAALME
ncbi:unnamed protein product [Effrenium voratum]|uniref:EF-hand domain-containing protein n=1 Tax=Effrenium voratum TaxID=2562239 RepID=A0AA36MJW7_9DINO|nr:unnamed protein product [Effrenium voratum]